LYLIVIDDICLIIVGLYGRLRAWGLGVLTILIMVFVIIFCY